MEQSNDESLPSLIDLLFFGSPNQTSYLLPTPSRSFLFTKGSLLQIQSPETCLNALIPRFPFDFLGKDYKLLYLPCTPAHEIFLPVPLDSLPQCDSIGDSVPDVMRKGFIKTKQKTGFQAFRSGKRSAIFYEKGKFYRLKGCGNEDAGFIKSVGKVSINPDSQEIRGCHFRHTVKRELFMAAKLDEYLAEYGFESANKSVGFYLYSDKIPEIDETLGNVFPKVQKFCGVFETLGEKRLATHLLQGFEALLREMIRFGGRLQGTKMNVQELFPPERLWKDGSFMQTPVCLDTSEKEVLLDLFGFLRENQLSFPLNPSLQEFAFSIMQNLAIKPPYSDIFNQIFKELLNEKEENPIFNDFLGISAVIFARIGFELGRVKAIFTEKRVNWGYYLDHHSYLAHCNAHPNNFVILPDWDKSQNLLSPLDFDLAFEEKEFININYEENSYGENDKELFQTFLQQEQTHLELAMAGVENMDNFTYYTFSRLGLEPPEEKVFNGLNILLRDVLRRFYLKGKDLSGKFELEGFEWNKNNKKIYDLIKISLIVTHDCIA